MAPSGKRKRGDRSYSYDEEHSGRPSPHRPQNLAMASPQQNNSPRGGRRGSRGRGGYNSSSAHNPSSAQQSPTAMAPPTYTHQVAPRPAPATPSQTPAPPKEPPFKPSGRDVPESNEHLTPERVARWNADARNAVIQAAVTAQQAGDGFNLNIVFFEIIHAAGEGLMSPAELGSVVRDIVTAPTDDLIDPIVYFLDCISSYAELDPKREDVKKTQPIQHLLIATEIDPNQMRRQLEEKLLEQTALVRQSFHVKGVRATTKAMYQQANYNLLREETEGYSKLMTEYFTTVNSEPPRHDVVSDTFERVNALIGTFDLDVGRVLDVTLDVFANLLVKHYRFFIKYLRVSTWWPTQLGTDNVEWQTPDVKALPNWALPTSQNWYYTDEEKYEQLRLREARDVKFWQRVAELGERNAIKAFFELGSRPITRTLREADKSDLNASNVGKKTATQEWVDQWIADTGTLPPLGNEVAAQLLGFKLQFYASNLRDPSDVLPDNLIYLAALLIKIGFISIIDLWEHLYPQAEDLEKLQIKLRAEKEEKEAKRKGKTANALTMAGALSDDSPSVPAVSRLRDAESKPSSKPESERNTPAQSDEEPKPALPEPVDQKVALLRSLLCIGAIPEALFIIGRNKWMLELYPDLHSYIFRLAHYSLSKVYESSRPVPPGQVPVSTKGTIPNSITRANDYVPRRTLRWAKPELKDAGDGIDYRFYWDDWADNVPVCQSVDDVFLFCQSFLGLVGPECGRDVLLLTKLARIGRKSIIDDPSSQNMKRWSDFLATFLVPALTFTGENPGVVNEMWELLKRFDTATRYTIYHQWEQSFKPVMKTAFAEVIYKTNQILNRVANTNTRQMGRAIAKLACACPVKVFKQTLERGQQYLNMIRALVDCSHYLTELGYDCLTFSLVINITAGNRPTTQSDGMLTEGWLKNAASFVAKVYTAYSKHMDPKPILEYISTQLLAREGELFVMKVLEELITSMGGVSLPGALKEESVVALSAGPRLRKFTLENLNDERYKAKLQRPAERLMNHFRESALAPPILIALADQVQAYLYRENQRKVPDKVVLFNYDNLKLNFFQFLDYLRHHLTIEEFDNQIPGLVELMSEYYLDTEFAFLISRDSISAKANAIRLQPKEVPETISGGDVIMEEAASSKEVTDVAIDKTGDVEMGDAASSGTISGEKSANQTIAHEDSVTDLRSNAEIDRLVSQLQAALPEKFGNHPCPTFLVTFWQLSLQHVQDPKGDVLKQQYQEAKDRTIRDATANDGRRKDVEKIREARKEADLYIDELEDFAKQSQLIQSSLQDEMYFWFPDVPSMDPGLHMTLLQDCFLARARMSLQDAQFSASMLFFMHKSKVPKFRLIKMLDDLFNTGRLAAMFFSMSEDESKNVGRFMNDILQELGRWHSNERIYKQFECVKVFNDEGRPKNPDSFLKYSEFRLLLGKWHNKIHDALHGCLRHGEPGDKSLKTTAQYTELRNSINILKAVAPSFPRMRENATSLKEQLKYYEDEKKEERADIRVAASSIQFEFQKNEKQLRSHTMFVTGKEDPKESTPARAATPVSAKTADQDAGFKKLSASAQPFQPKPSIT
ncbi:THO2 plays a role in transcriptional elongation [Paraconiothyrium brasiliense]|uniref:THO complex subunit 2 n=1 Tax=Paraconiothyrium brasiliense TaxID=300254 RepID=A0ABR3RVC2_9PLEO